MLKGKAFSSSRKIKYRFGVITDEVVPGGQRRVSSSGCSGLPAHESRSSIERHLPRKRNQTRGGFLRASVGHVRGSYAFSSLLFSRTVIVQRANAETYAHAHVHACTQHPSPFRRAVSTARSGQRSSFTKAILQAVRNLVARGRRVDDEGADEKKKQGIGRRRYLLLASRNKRMHFSRINGDTALLVSRQRYVTLRSSTETWHKVAITVNRKKLMKNNMVHRQGTGKKKKGERDSVNLQIQIRVLSLVA